MATLTSPPQSARSTTPRTATGLIRRALAQPLSSYYLVIATGGLLLGLGILMVLSASSVTAEVVNQDAYYYVKRQLTFGIAGLVAAWILQKFTIRGLRMLAWPSLLLSVILLILTFTPLGVEVAGNRNWIQFGSSFARLQPSEFAKLAMILWGADHLSRKEKVLDHPREWVSFLLVTGLLIGLVVMQRDMGTAVIMALIMVSILFLAGAPWRILFSLAAVTVVSVVAMVFISPNRMKRLIGFLNPGDDIEGVNQQPLRALYALASGGWLGQGLGESKQKWGMLVEAHTDYIFAVIGEELGLLGSIIVLGLFLLLGYTGLRIALRSDSSFCRHAAGGVAAWFTLQALVNIAVVLRLLPVMGVPLPLVSYGGSSLLATVIALGVLARCALEEPDARRVRSKDSSERPTVWSVVGGR